MKKAKKIRKEKSKEGVKEKSKEKVREKRKESKLHGLSGTLRDAWKRTRLTSVLIVLYDVLFYVFLYVGFVKYMKSFKNAAMMLQSPDIVNSFISPNEANVQGAMAVLQKFYIGIIWNTFLLVLFIIVVWSLSRYFIWQNISREKFSIKQALKLMPLNLLWLIIALIPIYVLFAPFVNYVNIGGVQGELPAALSVMRVLLIALIIVIAYFTDIMHLAFIRTGKGFRSLLRAFKYGVRRAYPAFTGYLCVWLAGYLLFRVLSINGLSTGEDYILIGFVFLSFSWIKIFFNSAIDIKKD